MERQEQLLNLCKDVIRLESTSGHEDKVVARIQEQMKLCGFDEIHVDRYGSVVGWLNGNRPGKTVLLDGHMDTVEVIDADRWVHDPFGAEVEDGRLYGRGTSDMKCSLMSMLMAAAWFAEDTGRDFSGRVCVSGTVHEECFEGVSAREVTKFVKPDMVIVGEATTGTVKIGQRGRAEIVVETEGVSCHSSNPHKGINAVYHMMEVVQEIRKIRPNDHPILGEGILELTDIKSEPYPGASVVPSRCRVTYDRRTLVGETKESVLAQVQQAVDRVKERIPELKARVFYAEGEERCWTGETIRAERFFPAWLLEEDHPLVQKALAGLKEAGVKTEISHFAFCTNGSHFCGEAGIPTIGYGPSLESLAHVRDEYVEIEELNKACRGYQGILRSILCDG